MMFFYIFGLFASLFFVIYDAAGHREKAVFWLALSAICAAVLIGNDLLADDSGVNSASGNAYARDGD